LESAKSRSKAGEKLPANEMKDQHPDQQDTNTTSFA